MDFMNLSSIRQKGPRAVEIKEETSKDIAIIGISGQMALANNADAFWENLVNKVECVRDFPLGRQEDSDRYLRFQGMNLEQRAYYKSAYLDRIDEFDPKTFHLTPKEAKLMDPRQRLFLKHTWNAIEDAGYNPEELRGQRVGVYAGISDFGYETYFDMITRVDPSLIEIGVSGNFQAMLPSRVSYILDFKGPSLVIDTACSSSLVALHLACQALKNKECDSAIVGSVRLHLSPLMANYRIGFESTDGCTRAFDDSASGTGVGEGAVAVMVKPLHKAKADGDHVYAVIRGSAINQDGNSIGITAPNASAQQDVIERAWKDASVTAEQISYIETHGTGTKLGDPIEIEGITKAFSKSTNRKQFCAIGSVKSNIGHLYEVAGLASVIKCIYALKSRVIPPSINYVVPNRTINFLDSPVFVNVRSREWTSDSDKRLCGISSFGLSGTNCHLVLEEFKGENGGFASSGPVILPLSGKTREALLSVIRQYRDDIDLLLTQNLKDVCFTASAGRIHHRHRLALVVENGEALRRSLEIVLETPWDDLKSLADQNIYYHFVDHEIRTQSPTENEGSSQNRGGADLNSIHDVSTINRLAEGYVAGHNLPWADLYSSQKRNRVRLPTSPFQEERYWVDIPDVSSEKRQLQRPEPPKVESAVEILLQGRADGLYTDSEKKIGEVARSVMDYNSLDIRDNFYELGGDSILALQMHARINEIFSVKITVGDIISNPSIERLAAYMDSLVLKPTEPPQRIPAKSTELPGDDQDIAVIGVAGRFPMAANVDQFWKNICDQVYCISSIPKNRKEDLKNYLKSLALSEDHVKFAQSGYLGDIDKFDHEYFGISLKEATLMDPNQRGFLEVVYELLESSGYGGQRLVGTKTGVFVGFIEEYLYNYRRFVYESDPSLTKMALSGNLSAIIPARVSYALDLRGPSICIDSTCSSSLVALNTAVKSLRSGECDAAIVGGTKIKLLPLEDAESQIGTESTHHAIRAFDDDADGLVEGEAIGAVLLKPLKQAIADGDLIRAVIKGSSVNQDGTSMGIMAPRAETQAQVITSAWKDAGIEPETIGYIETHGTGTKLGDLVEFEGLKKAFSLFTDKRQFCAIGSVKSNVGHLFQSAGITGFIKAVLALENKTIPPSLFFDRPNRLMDFEESPLYFNNVLRDWPTSGTPRRCGVSAFGFSGTNCHVVLEEYVRPEPPQTQTLKPYVVTFSAKKEESLSALIANYECFLRDSPTISLPHLSFTTNIGRGHYSERVAIVVSSVRELAETLTKLTAVGWRQPGLPNVFSGSLQRKETSNNCDSVGSISAVEVRKAMDSAKDADGLTSPSTREKLASLYVSGANILWEELYPLAERRAVVLPTYPFLRSRCWFQPRPRKMYEAGDVKVLNDYEVLELEARAFPDEPQDDQEEGSVQKERGETEAIILQAFKDVLAVKRVRPTDNFFELGGNSLKATRLAAKIYELFGLLIPLSDILKYPTVHDFSLHISEMIENNEGAETIPVLPDQDFYDLSLKQEEIWLSAQIYEDPSAMNITSTSYLHNFDIELLRRSFEAVINRHSLLRAIISVVDGTPKLTIGGSDRILESYRSLDLREASNVDEAVAQIINGEVSTAFTMQEEPLIRITVAQVEAQKHLLVFVVHHIIADWWSMNNILSDLLKIYAALKRDEAPELPQLFVSYTDFAVWHREKLAKNGDLLRRHWNSVLKGPLPVINISTDFPRPPVKVQTGRRFDATFEPSVMGRLKQYADQNRGTTLMTILSGVYSLLYLYSGQNDIIVGTNTSGRENPHLQDLVGYFINVIPLRIRIDGQDDYTKIFSRVQQTTLDAFEHQDYPFGSMLEDLPALRDTSRSPVFDIMVQLIIDPISEDDRRVRGARIEEIPSDSLESKYDLVFNFFERGKEIHLELEYSNRLFKEETIGRMVHRLAQIFDEFSRNQERGIDSLTISGTGATRRALTKRNREQD